VKRTTIAIDLAKNVFQVAEANRNGRVLRQRRLSRRQFQRYCNQLDPSHVVMEACGSAFHWARTLMNDGHRVSLLPPHYVRPYVRRNKTDRSDCEAILEAARSGQIPTVAVRSIQQQEIMALHRLRSQWVSTRTARINAVRGFLRELGIAIPAGARNAVTQARGIVEADAVPRALAGALQLMLEEIEELSFRVRWIEKQLGTIDEPIIHRLQQIPGIGLLTATALFASVGNIHSFPTGRHFASWLGLTPREHSSGSHRRLGRITKQGNTYVRCLLVHGARAALLAARRRERGQQPMTVRQRWATTLQVRAGHNKTAVALANRMARTAWAMWTKDQDYQDRKAM
jgi:transposase